MQTNLPTPFKQDSAEATRLYFNAYGTKFIEFSANEVAAAISFFEQNGFATGAATTSASVILDQAKADGLSVFTLLDTLKAFNGLQLSALVAEILNNNRPATSSLGYKDPSSSSNVETRNISA